MSSTAALHIFQNVLKKTGHEPGGGQNVKSAKISVL